MQRSYSNRKRLTVSEKERILATYRGSRLSQREFAAEAGISVSALRSWLRQAPAGTNPAGPSAFIEIPNRLPPAPKQSCAYRLELPTGLHLEIGSGFIPAELLELCRVLQNL